MGFGHSRYLTNAFSVEDYAKWTKRVISALGLYKPHVIAHSFGCRVAIKMACGQEDIFDKMVLTGPAGVILNRGVSYRIKVGAYRLVKKIAPRFAQRKFGSKEYRSLSPIMKESYKKIVNEDLRACARQVKNEVLLIEGAEDTVTPLCEAEAYLHCLKKGKLKMIEGGHFAFAENPVVFNLITEEFLYG